MRGMNKVYYLKLEIRDLEEELKTIASVSAMNYSGMPHSTDVSDTTYNLALKGEKLFKKLVRKKIKLLEEIDRIESIIEQIEDDEIRAMARMRFIKTMKWEDIGEQVHMDRTVCSRKVRKYLQGMEL